MFKKMPFILLAIILGVMLLGHHTPPLYQSTLYGLSLSIKSLIVFVLPFVVFSLLFKTAIQLANKASKIVLLLLAFICGSNFLSTLFSYSVGTFAYNFDLSIDLPAAENALQPAWNFILPRWVENDQAMFAGLFLGALLGKLAPVFAQRASSELEKITTAILRGILLTIPLFITGFIFKMNHDGLMVHIFRHYSLIFMAISTALLAYISLLYLAINNFQAKEALRSLKNLLPAAIAGFGSMSSAAALPLTILGAENNSKNPTLARSIIPLTVNIHLVGDCFAIPIFAFAVLKSFGAAEPAFLSYLVFAGYFVMAKFSVAAVPGGGILVMLPILEKYLGFNAEMLSLITALYILFDPVITCANILGNGGFALGMEKLITAASTGKQTWTADKEEQGASA